eukprot:1136622-Pelagomonas_calceolata.AAC.7
MGTGRRARGISQTFWVLHGKGRLRLGIESRESGAKFTHCPSAFSSRHNEVLSGLALRNSARKEHAKSKPTF